MNAMRRAHPWCACIQRHCNANGMSHGMDMMKGAHPPAFISAMSMSSPISAVENESPRLAITLRNSPEGINPLPALWCARGGGGGERHALSGVVLMMCTDVTNVLVKRSEM